MYISIEEERTGYHGQNEKKLTNDRDKIYLEEIYDKGSNKHNIEPMNVYIYNITTIGCDH